MEGSSLPGVSKSDKKYLVTASDDSNLSSPVFGEKEKKVAKNSAAEDLLSKTRARRGENVSTIQILKPKAKSKHNLSNKITRTILNYFLSSSNIEKDI